MHNMLTTRDWPLWTISRRNSAGQEAAVEENGQTPFWVGILPPSPHFPPQRLPDPASSSSSLVIFFAQDSNICSLLWHLQPFGFHFQDFILCCQISLALSSAITRMVLFKSRLITQINSQIIDFVPLFNDPFSEAMYALDVVTRKCRCCNMEEKSRPEMSAPFPLLMLADLLNSPSTLCFALHWTY